jgi:CubicO group peptidase (beta-lactamase class C family)
MRAAFHVCLVFCVLAASRLNGQEAKDSWTDLRAELEKVRSEHRIQGIVALVVRGDRVIAQGAAGVRKGGATEAITVHDQLHLGSCTKAMTATLAAMLVDEGKLRWTTTLDQLFGDTVPNIHPAWRNVTLHQVLVHRAGLHRGDDPGIGLDARLIPEKATLPEVRRILIREQLSRAPPEAQPGEREIYSNVGFVLVGAVLEKITGQAWEDLMQERLFKPLGIVTGGFGAPGKAGLVEQPWGHDRSGDPIEPGGARSDLPRYAGPCGNVHMAIHDWAKFISLHLRGDPANPQRHLSLLSAPAFEYLHRANPGETYSPGWAVGTVDFAKGTRSGDVGKIFGHEGTNGVWYSKTLLAPEIDLAVLVVCNRGGAAIGGKAVAVASDLMQKFASSPIP